MPCYYCGCHNGGHDLHCPKPGTLTMEIWNHGYSDGRAGKSCAAHTLELYPRRIYQMGWDRGNIALEKAANG